ncbi:Gep3p [Sugiyamaella lignohabitans]|uniref:Genetic interactor of prohibitins 3, mitochondrial n=1 Tax=Sugiyamaella lignohabitans TaxID=796027 RepID=A0A167DV76_9ASCO|nr:Gep3p [Sugiyamaella lignohabitans]ANB13332.1 Gep3p [Sugiyamaella lignohabitans]
MDNIAKRCFGCGTAFHEHVPDTPGFNPFEAEKKKAQKKATITSIKVEKSRQADVLFESLDEDKKEFLLSQGTVETGMGSPQNADPHGPSVAISKAQDKAEKRSKMSKIFCKWCRDSVNGKELRLSVAVESKKQLLDQIPKEATIVHLFDAMDFPTTVDFELMNIASKRPGRILWIMNRSDLIMPDNERTQTRLLKYVREELNRIAGVPPNNVMAISSNYNWNADEVFSQLSNDNYLVGHANTGKSTLALYLSYKFRQQGNSRKFWGLGSWSNPFITQQSITYLLEGNKYLTDLPSYPEHATNNIPGGPMRKTRAGNIIESQPTATNTETGVYDYLKPNLVRKLTNGHRLLRTPGMYNCPQVVVSTLPTQLISIGGLVAVKRDSPIHLICWSIFPDSNYKTRVVSSLEKITEINQSTQKTHERWSMVNKHHSNSPLNKKMEIKFGGEGVSLAIRGVGLCHFHVYGRIPEDGVTMEVYSMDNIKIMRRDDILPFIRNPRNRLKELKDSRREAARDKSARAKKKSVAKKRQIATERMQVVDAYADM